MMCSVSLVAILLAVAAKFIIGMLWYSPLLFGNSWAKYMHVKPDPSRMMCGMVASVISAAIMALVMACFMQRLGINTIESALYFAAMCWLAFIAATSFEGKTWSGYPIQLFLITTGAHLIGMSAMAVVLVQLM